MRLSIFTPTYNRKEQLQFLYKSIIESLKDISKNDFVEWIIIDDGSTEDNTSIIDSFIENNIFKIKYYKQENGGKHTAFNKAIGLAESDIFICIDDDDQLTKNAISDIFLLARKYENKGFGGFVGRVVDENRVLLGKTIFDDVLISNTIEIRDRYHFWGEPEVYFTSILKGYKFDVFPGERFLTEAYLFDEMSTKYPLVYTNVQMMIKKYLPNGLTDNQLKIRMQCPMGCEAYYYKRRKICKGFRNKFKAEINRQRFGRYAKSRPYRKVDIYKILAIPVAWLISIKDRHDCPNIY